MFSFRARALSLFLEEEEEDLLFVSSDETSRLVPLVLREEKKTRARERERYVEEFRRVFFSSIQRGYRRCFSHSLLHHRVDDTSRMGRYLKK